MPPAAETLQAGLPSTGQFRHPRSGSRWARGSPGSGRTGHASQPRSESHVRWIPPVRKLGHRFSKEVLGEQAPLEGLYRRHSRPPKPNGPESSWFSNAILGMVEFSSDSDPARTSKLAPTAPGAPRRKPPREPASEAPIHARRDATEVPSPEAVPTPGRCWNPWEIASIRRLTLPDAGFSVYGYGDSANPRFTPPEAVQRARRGAVRHPQGG